MRRISVMKRMWTVACLLTALAFGSTARASGVKETLDLIPSDAWGFVMIRSLDQLDSTASRIQQSLGLPIPPQISAMALAPLNLVDAVDMTRPICVVVLDVQKMGGMNEAAVAIVPAKDPKAVLEKLSAEPSEEEGVSRVTVMGEPGFAAIKGKVVVIGPGQDAVTKVAKSKKTIGSSVSAGRSEAMGASDVYMSISLGAVATAYKDMVMPFMQMAMAAQDPTGETAQHIIKMFGEVAAFDLGLTFNDEGLAVVARITPTADGDLEKMIAADKGTEDALLAVLPKDKYLFSLASTINHSNAGKTASSDKPISGLLKSMRIPGATPEQLASMDKEYLKLHENLKRVALSFSALEDTAEGMIGLAIVAETNDSAAFVASLRKLFTTAMGLSDDEDFTAVKKHIVHKADAESVGGGKADTIEIRVDEIADATDGDKADVEKMKKVLGSDMRIRFGAVGDNHVVMSLGGGKKRFEKIATGAKSSGGLSTDAGIAAVSKGLPAKKVAEMYFAVDHIMQTVKKVAAAVGEEDEVPFDMPTLNAPVAVTSAVEDTASRIDFVVPMKLIKACKEMFEKYSAAEAADMADDGDESDSDDGDSADGSSDGEESGSDDGDSDEDSSDDGE